MSPTSDQKEGEGENISLRVSEKLDNSNMIKAEEEDESKEREERRVTNGERERRKGKSKEEIYLHKEYSVFTVSL